MLAGVEVCNTLTQVISEAQGIYDLYRGRDGERKTFAMCVAKHTLTHCERTRHTALNHCVPNIYCS